MKPQQSDAIRQTGLSVVIPSFNSAKWLPSTLSALKEALDEISWDAEVIIVDDGSTDDTPRVVAEITKNFPYAFKLISQPNQGRFLARWNGAQHARYSTLLLLDSRVPADQHSLSYVHKNSPEGPNTFAWNGHVTTDPTAPLIGHFWEVPIHVFWGTYLAHPQRTIINLNNFNRMPKGTGFFICPTQIFLDSALENWPEVNAALTSDDTKIIRTICERTTLIIDPNFSATYRPRATVFAFIKHSFARGTFFVDSFAGVRASTNVLIVLMGLIPTILITTLLALIATGFGTTGIWLVLGLIMCLAVPAVIALMNGCSRKGVSAYFMYLLLFALPYWAGICRGLWVHRHSIYGTRQDN